MIIRPTIAIAIAGCLAIGIAATLYHFSRSGSNVVSSNSNQPPPRLHVPDNPNLPVATASLLRDIASIANQRDIAAEDVSTLIAIAEHHQPTTDYQRLPHGEQRERLVQQALIHTYSLSALEHIAGRSDVEPALRNECEAVVIMQLDSEFPRLRNGAVAFVFAMKIHDRPDVRASLLRMIRSDPDPSVRANIERRLSPIP